MKIDTLLRPRKNLFIFVRFLLPFGDFEHILGDLVERGVRFRDIPEANALR